MQNSDLINMFAGLTNSSRNQDMLGSNKTTNQKEKLKVYPQTQGRLERNPTRINKLWFF